jgi:hypothetical protein
MKPETGEWPDCIGPSELSLTVVKGSATDGYSLNRDFPPVGISSPGFPAPITRRQTAYELYRMNRQRIDPAVDLSAAAGAFLTGWTWTVATMPSGDVVSYVLGTAVSVAAGVAAWGGSKSMRWTYREWCAAKRRLMARRRRQAQGTRETHD